MCPTDVHCWEWARDYMDYFICDVKGGVSLVLGLISVISWSAAEIPQIITNYKQKSGEGLSIAFLFTWTVGDLFNLVGCLLEPATLPTQLYTAILYTLTTFVLAGQAVYYGLIYDRLKSKRQSYKHTQLDAVEQKRHFMSDVTKQHDSNGDRRENRTSIAPSSPIPLPALYYDDSAERELYYMSARSLSTSPTPTAGSFLAQIRTPISVFRQNSVEEPFLCGHASPQSVSPSNKTMLCVITPLIFFFGTLNLHLMGRSKFNMVFENLNQGVVMQVGRKLLQVSGGSLQEPGGEGSSVVAMLLGWGMTAIYLGGRLPQICLNISRGNVEGLNPLMFMFAVIGNTTYVASILVNSLDWSKLSANLPWLVDAGGCALFDTFILIQFIYFRYKQSCSKSKNQMNHS